MNRRTIGTFALAALTLAACGQPKHVSVDHAWVRLAAVPSRPAVAYFTIHGGPAAATLINVTTAVTIRSEMHESMSAGQGMASMRPIASVAVPAGATVAFAPGGRHVMLFDVNPGVKPGGSIVLTLSFSDGSRLTQDADVIAAGDPAPK